ncbi:OLC1v1005813C2 [Oldenlandia corymbosa var. corymbosa]|nr:OLC1v1005813C2 [Oldenlandia corymbosa var. corymbosa]
MVVVSNDPQPSKTGQQPAAADALSRLHEKDVAIPEKALVAPPCRIHGTPEIILKPVQGVEGRPQA